MGQRRKGIDDVRLRESLQQPFLVVVRAGPGCLFEAIVERIVAFLQRALGRPPLLAPASIDVDVGKDAK